MNYTKNIIVIFGISDLLLFVFVFGKALLQSQVPFWSEMINAMDAVDNFFDGSLLVHVKWFYLPLMLISASSIVSGYLLLKGSLYGVKLSLFQAVFKLAFLSVFSFSYISSVLVNSLGVNAFIAFSLIYLMEVAKTWVLVVSYKNRSHNL
ncbi:hypothetical protein [Aliidiomarina celeris]|uniref:hypothetical protein n=1 Tax=Aliidiomarina celeris TaxID=2249428 RepID=UPI000DE922BD|nr:hypothetical protein [Aliidiomarina celeris]